jgi:hypothetical protein
MTVSKVAFVADSFRNMKTRALAPLYRKVILHTLCHRIVVQMTNTLEFVIPLSGIICGLMFMIENDPVCRERTTTQSIIYCR